MSAPEAVEFTDEGFRDGPQSLWGSRMRTQTMVNTVERLDAVGYQKSLIVSGATFESALLHLHEDPWVRMDVVSGLMRNTAPAAQIRGRTLFGWQQYPDDVVDLFIDVLARHGIEWLLIYEALNDMRLIERHVEAARRNGMRVTIPVCYSVSPVHTPEYFHDVFSAAARMDADSVSLLDASGLLDPDTAGQLSKVAGAALTGTGAQLEMNVHDLTGRALACYEAGLAAGVAIVATTPRAVAYGRSIPAVEDVLGAAERVGRTTTLDPRALDDVESFYRWAAYVQDEPIPASVALSPTEIDEFTQHQIPGGMMSNLVKQLTDLGIVERLPEILDEVGRVRADLGYPVMVTPCSQMVGVQATLNVMSGERYANSPVEVRNYLLGIYGTPPGALNPDVVDRVLGDEPPSEPYERLKEPMLPGFIAKHGPFHSDEDLLLALMYSEKSLEAFRDRQGQLDVPAPQAPETAFVSALLSRHRLSSLEFRC